MAPDGRVETSSRDIWLKIHFNNRPIKSCVRIYFIYFIIMGLYWVPGHAGVRGNEIDMI